MQFENKFVDVNGIRTRYIECGTGEPLILLHGGGAGADAWSNWGHILGTYGHHMRAIAVDMFGFGDTDMPDPATAAYTQQTRTSHIIGFIEALGLESVHLVGNSMGGTTSMGVTLQRPDLVRSLVLMGAAVNMAPADMAANRVNLAPVLAYDFTREGMLALIKGLTFSYEPTPAVVDYRFTRSIRSQAQVANTATMAWVKQNGLCYSAEQIASITKPTLVVSGKNDKMVPVGKMLEVINLIPQAWGYIIPNCGHWIMIEYPKEFADVTLRFFGKLG